MAKQDSLDTLDAVSLQRLARDLRTWLDRARMAVAGEIRSYPTPIPRCDAQFNHLVAQRDLSSLLLGEIDAALECRDVAALQSAAARFAALPAFADSADERNLRDRIGANPGRG